MIKSATIVKLPLDQLNNHRKQKDRLYLKFLVSNDQTG